jgi:hypothetical protein
MDLSSQITDLQLKIKQLEIEQEKLKKQQEESNILSKMDKEMAFKIVLDKLKVFEGEGKFYYLHHYYLSNPNTSNFNGITLESDKSYFPQIVSDNFDFGENYTTEKLSSMGGRCLIVRQKSNPNIGKVYEETSHYSNANNICIKEIYQILLSILKE